MKWLALLFGVLTGAANAQQMTLTGTGADKNINASSYVGPGDIAPGALVWAGFRGYSRAYAAPGNNPAADLCDAATGLICVTINILSNGNFDAATAQSSAACAVSCVVKRMYDQTNNGFGMTNGTLADLPFLTFNCQNGHVCISNNVDTALLQSGPALSLSSPYSYAGVFLRNAFNSQYEVLIADLREFGVWMSNATANTIGLFCNNTQIVYAASNPDGYFHGVVGVCSTTVGGIYTDGSTVLSNTTAASFNNKINIIGDGNTGEVLLGKFGEAGIWPGVIANPTGLLANERNYWGF